MQKIFTVFVSKASLDAIVRIRFQIYAQRRVTKVTVPVTITNADVYLVGKDQVVLSVSEIHLVLTVFVADRLNAFVT